MSQSFFAGRDEARFWALVTGLVPRSQQFHQGQRRAGIAIVNDFIATQEPRLHWQLRLLLRVMEGVAWFQAGVPLTQLSPGEKKRVLSWFFNSSSFLLRKGFWGVNTLAKMAVFGQPSLYRNIGYRRKELPHD